MTATVLIVDAANVVGSVPDGWWRDRRAAAERLRDRLADVGSAGLGELAPPLDVVLVVEGKARGVLDTPTVSVVSAPGSGDDEMVRLTAGYADRHVVVVTADRELQRRVGELGARVLGPSTITGT